MWTNHTTGEVSEVCPWLVAEDEGVSPFASPSKGRGDGGVGGAAEGHTEEEIEEGTGAPVYDPSELQGLFDYLDTHPSPATSPAKTTTNTNTNTATKV